MNGTTRRNITGWLFVLPWVVALFAFVGYPFFAGLYFSFCDYPPLKSPMLIGAGNYQELAGDPAFHRALGVTLIYAALAVPLGVILALTLAMFLNTKIRGQAFYRVIYYLPHLVPTVAVAILWMWIFNDSIGLLNMGVRGLMKSADWWSGRFFDLPAAMAGKNFFAARSAFLALPVLLLFLPKKSKGFLRFLRAMGVLCAALAAVTLVYALLCWAMPVDMNKLRSGPGWLTDGTSMPSGMKFAPSWALWALIIMSLWSVGQMAVIYLAKLQDVPAELYEAAELDGASWWGKTWNVTIPMISPVILFNVVMAIIGAFQVFAEPYIMTAGGPEDKTRFVAMFVYEQAFRYQRLGYASAVAWVLFLVIVLMTLMTFRISRNRVHYFGR